MNYYIGHPLQIRGAEKYVLQEGKGDGMHFLCVRNGLGLEAWISLDRCGDISRLTFKGDNISYFSPCGYVAPAYYDGVGEGFLKSFTAGFFTTCGLTTVGDPCEDHGEPLPLHGTIGNQPAMLNAAEETENGISVRLTVEDRVLGGRKMTLRRSYFFSYTENTFSFEDTVTNEGSTEEPYMVLYHCNMGYPLLTEKSILKIPNTAVRPRTDHAAECMDAALQIEKPQADYEEVCYYYDVAEKNGLARAGIYNREIGKGLVIGFDRKDVPCFTEWKMMGQSDYVLGLEPGNCIPDGRAAMRDAGTLRTLKPAESGKTGLLFSLFDNEAEWDKAF